jgi:hypothetical protein
MDGAATCPSNHVEPYTARLPDECLSVLSRAPALDCDGLTLSQFCTTSVKGNE